MKQRESTIHADKIQHMLGVAEYMRDRAKDWGMNPDECYVIGFLHDIGCLEGREGHEENGAKLLKDIGISEKVAFAIKNHGQLLRELEDVTPLLAFVVEADMSVDSKGNTVGFEERLKDIARNHGKDSDEYKCCAKNIEFVKGYLKEFHIPFPEQETEKRD